MADVFERLGCVLAANIEQDLFTTSVITSRQPHDHMSEGRCDGRGGPRGGGSDVRVLVHEARGVVDLVVDDQVQVLLGRVLRDVRVCELLGVRHGVRVGVDRAANGGAQDQN